MGGRDVIAAIGQLEPATLDDAIVAILLATQLRVWKELGI
jgi:hypothetical protein